MLFLKSLALVFLTFSTYANELSLKQLLSEDNLEQKELLSNQVQSETLQNTINYSPWSTNLSSSVEKRFKITEEFTGRTPNETESLQWQNRVKQNTPYGINLNLEYYKELDSPTFNNSFRDQYYRGFLEISLYADFLGKSSRSILKSQNSTFKLFEKKVNLDHCSNLTKKYIEALELQKQHDVLSKALSDSEKVLLKLKRAIRKGALHKTSVTSLQIDTANTKAEMTLVKENLNQSLVDLEAISGKEVQNLMLTDLSNPKIQDQSLNVKFLEQEVLKQELTNIKNRLSKINIDRNQDIALYGGVDSVNFAQRIFNVEGQTNYSFLGVKASMQFGDNSIKSERKRLSSLKKVKEIQASRLAKTSIQKEKVQRQKMTNLKYSFDSLNKQRDDLKSLERKSYRNFYNGKSSHFEFISTKNQITNFKRALIKTKFNFWRAKVDHLYLTGNHAKLCSGDGVL